MKTEFSTGTALTLKAAINELHAVCDKWYKIGVQLEIPIPDLKSISLDSMDPLCDTLYCWMKNVPSPSWRCLADALKAPLVGENLLAEEIEKKYCGPEEQSSFDVSETSVQAKRHQGTRSHQSIHVTYAIYLNEIFIAHAHAQGGKQLVSFVNLCQFVSPVKK